MTTLSVKRSDVNQISNEVQLLVDWGEDEVEQAEEPENTVFDPLLEPVETSISGSSLLKELTSLEALPSSSPMQPTLLSTVQQTIAPTCMTQITPSLHTSTSTEVSQVSTFQPPPTVTKSQYLYQVMY